MMILDTDHLSELQLANSQRGRNLEARLSTADDRDVRYTIISFEEQARGWFAQIKSARDGQTMVRGYQRLARMLEFHQSKNLSLLTFDDGADQMHHYLKTAKSSGDGGMAG